MKTPMYNTVLFTGVWEEPEEFYEDWSDSPFTSFMTEDDITLIFFLLYARYGNSPIANSDVNQWKFKVFSTIFQYGPTWSKRLEIQQVLKNLDLTSDDVLVGATSIYNHAFNPNSAPTIGTTDELAYINDQNVSKHKKNKLTAYAELWELLATDVTEEFIRRFAPLFKMFVAPENPVLFFTPDDDDEGEED